ncbi:EAL domain-containing protein [Acidithiobacillus ferriphilus]|uniref:EAL domain-containing protein n=1 Tax=Acidithiobacillus ferriphilus TaxID=1689834 RepID=UPI00232E90A2|nr:EAL domain-containing protein [Acidithiobacillus ferriphilus]WCE93161.1 EAL domain-containing protein [Acidithiobacillus ferriphilus]
METTSTLPNFLGLHDSDFQFIERYRVLLEAETGALAHDFYDYLLSHPVTAAVFRDFSHARLDALIQKQAEHISGLLASHLNKSWRESMRKLGALHHRLGIEPSWLAGAYILYWRHWQKVLQDQVPEADRNALRDALFRLLIGDLMVQLDGYARASRETDADRLALFDVLLGVLAVPQGAESPRPEALLQQICEALPRKSASVRLAGYVVSGAMGDVLTLECMAGLPLPALQLPKTAGDPCWEALECGQTVIQSVEDPRAPEWIKDLHNRVEEIGIFPFGAEDLRGAILIGAREKGYFRRVGSDYFHAFAHLGEMVLQLRNQSLRDPLTGLPNRTLFLDRLEIAQTQALRNERLLGVALLDLDGFKQVNDRLGHAAGDQLLLAVVQRLQGYLRAGDTLARMGGDEFGLILPGLNSVEDLETLCNRLLATIREALDIQGEAISVSGSIGVTLYPLDDNDSRTLIQHADMALYAAKDAGRDRWHLHTLALNEAVQAEVEMRAMLEQALNDKRLILHYQPIVSSTGEIMSVEALIRLQHPEQGLLSPAVFFSALDHPRLARPVGRFVLETALRQGAIWQEAGLPLRISVNISTRHLLDARFLDDLREAMAKYPDMPPNQLEIEITESAPLSDMAGARMQLRICNQLGVHVALDDFGTGNASLTYLQQLHAQSIKIDQGFVRDIINDPKDLAIVAAVITASRMLGIKVIAEGVETAEHATLLTKMGCSHLQGYFFSRPLSPEAIPAWVTRFRPAPRSEDTLSSMDVLSPILEGHLLRMQMFLRALRHENPFPAHTLEADAEDFCHFGRWLRGEGLFKFGQSPDFAGIVTRHERIHQLAREAKSFLDEEDDEAALYQGHLLELENRLLVAELLAMTRKLP